MLVNPLEGVVQFSHFSLSIRIVEIVKDVWNKLEAQGSKLKA